MAFFLLPLGFVLFSCGYTCMYGVTLGAVLTKGHDTDKECCYNVQC